MFTLKDDGKGSARKLIYSHFYTNTKQQIKFNLGFFTFYYTQLNRNFNFIRFNFCAYRDRTKTAVRCDVCVLVK